MELNTQSNVEVVDQGFIRKIDIEYSLIEYKDEMICMINEYTSDLFGNDLKS